jgi:hypothetical protein
MTRAAHLRSLLFGLAVLPLLCTLQRPAFALIGIKPVSKAEAKDLGITVQAKPRPDSGDVWVRVDFKTRGDLEGFKWADLVVTKEGKRLLMAPLMPRKPAVESTAEETRVEFYIEPSLLSDATVTVVAYPKRLVEGVGYQLKMKDFIPSAAGR